MQAQTTSQRAPAAEVTPHHLTSGALRVGVDVASVPAVAASLRIWGRRYTERVFSPVEIADAGGSSSAERLAARFAAKEATMKVLGPDRETPPWRSIEIRSLPGGRPHLVLGGEAAALAARHRLEGWGLSMSHEGQVAIAVVLATAAWPSPAYHPARATADTLAVGAGLGSETRAPQLDDGRAGRLAGASPEAQAQTPPTTHSSNHEENPAMEKKIRTILAEQGCLGVDPHGIGADEDLYRHGLTSHASVNLMLALEDAFGVEFPDALLRRRTFASVSAIREALASLGCETTP